MANRTSDLGRGRGTLILTALFAVSVSLWLLLDERDHGETDIGASSSSRDATPLSGLRGVGARSKSMGRAKLDALQPSKVHGSVVPTGPVPEDDRISIVLAQGGTDRVVSTTWGNVSIELKDLDRSRPIQLTFSARSHRSHRTLLPAGIRDFGRIALSRGVVFRGRFLDAETKSPVAGVSAAVRSANRGSVSYASPTQTSNDDGLFEIVFPDTEAFLERFEPSSVSSVPEIFPVRGQELFASVQVTKMGFDEVQDCLLETQGSGFRVRLSNVDGKSVAHVPLRVVEPYVQFTVPRRTLIRGVTNEEGIATMHWPDGRGIHQDLQHTSKCETMMLYADVGGREVAFILSRYLWEGDKDKELIDLQVPAAHQIEQVSFQCVLEDKPVPNALLRVVLYASHEPKGPITMESITDKEGIASMVMAATPHYEANEWSGTHWSAVYSDSSGGLQVRSGSIDDDEDRIPTIDLKKCHPHPGGMWFKLEGVHARAAQLVQVYSIRPSGYIGDLRLPGFGQVIRFGDKWHAMVTSPFEPQPDVLPMQLGFRFSEHAPEVVAVNLRAWENAQGASGPLAVPLRAPNQRGLAITCQDSKGNAIPGCVVTYQLADGSRFEQVHSRQTVRADAVGVAHVAPVLEDRSYVLRATDHATKRKATLLVSGSGVTSRIMTLKPPVEVKVYVTLPDKTTPTWMNATLMYESPATIGRIPTRWNAKRGVAIVTCVPMGGSVEVLVGDKRGSNYRATRPWKAGTTELRIELGPDDLRR